MRKGLSVLFALTGTLTLAGCLFSGEKDPPTVRGRYGNRLDGLPPLTLLDSSRQAFAWMQALSGDAYAYRTYWRSFLSGSWGYEEVTVRAGKVVRDEIVANAPDSVTRVVRGEAEVGALAEGEAPAILDSLYAQCRRMLSEAPDPHRRYEFGYDGNYILETCGYTDDRLQDGPSIMHVEMQNWQWK